MSTTALSLEDLGTYQLRLQSLADRLAGDVTQLAAEATCAVGPEGTRAEPPNAVATVASTEGDEEATRGVLTSERELLSEVRDALARFKAGTFGRCGRCGRSIGKVRLNAIPYARLCIHCARTADDANGTPGG